MNISANVDKRAHFAFKEIANKLDFNITNDKKYSIQTIDNITFEIKYILDKKWLSKIYKLELSYTFQNLADFEHVEYIWNHSNKKWVSKDKRMEFNHVFFNKMMEVVFKTVDIEKAVIHHIDDQVRLKIILFPGSFIWTLIPPIHYFLRLKEEEISVIKKIPKIIEQNLIKPLVVV